LRRFSFPFLHVEDSFFFANESRFSASGHDHSFFFILLFFGGSLPTLAPMRHLPRALSSSIFEFFPHTGFLLFPFFPKLETPFL